ncbi:hypothetical protein DYU11_11710 [Fibrisoma montanum]|uniref:Recombinase RecT n=1 Tax=Fibrisoma montanum TaxID=2305895 RepID=A0A418MB84_9BACT|nr:hypothetical protein [Fibrisoma montanum]RIV23641.1 hypothetical protein DYU11_11710 [Fibrisoma montanum]
MTQSLIPTSTSDIQTVAQNLAQSGYFKDAQDATKAFVKVLAGAELGLPAFQSMSGIHIVQGKPVLGSGLIASIIKRSGRYNYKVVEHTAEVCRLDFYENGELIGTSEMTMKEAKAANMNMEWNRDKNAWQEKATWKNYPKNMLFNRAISNGAKWHCPDIFGGPIYSEGEIEEREPVQDVTAEVVHEAKPVARQAYERPEPAEVPTKPAPATGKKAVADQSKVVDAYMKDISNANDDTSFDWLESAIGQDGQIPDQARQLLIKGSIDRRIQHHVHDLDSVNVIKKRIVGWAKLLGQDTTADLLKDLIEAAGNLGIKYENKQFYIPEPAEAVTDAA